MIAKLKETAFAAAFLSVMVLVCGVSCSSDEQGTPFVDGFTNGSSDSELGTGDTSGYDGELADDPVFNSDLGGGNSGDGTQSPPRETDTRSPSTGADTEADTGDPGAVFEGTWGLLFNGTIKQTGIPLLKSQISIGRNWFLVELESDGKGNLTAYEKTCHIETKLETWLNRLIVPQAFIDALPVLERHVSIDSSEPGTPWVSDDVYEVRGARLQNEIEDPIPANNSAQPNDARSCDEVDYGEACDQDGDGHPGMTNVLSGALNCKVYVTQRWHAKFAGEIIDENTIAGPIVKNFSEQTVVAASSALCQTGEPGTASVMDKCPQHFYFKMVRIRDGGSCEDVMAMTSCDEDRQNCDADHSLPLNPRNDRPEECR